jgi:hypothetical protein
MLRAGEFRSITSLGEREFAVLQAIGLANESDFALHDGEIQRLLAAGLIQPSSFRGFDLTTRGQLVLANQRAQRMQHRNRLTQMLKRFRRPAD